MRGKKVQKSAVDEVARNKVLDLITLRNATFVKYSVKQMRSICLFVLALSLSLSLTHSNSHFLILCFKLFRSFLLHYYFGFFLGLLLTKQKWV